MRRLRSDRFTRDDLETAFLAKVKTDEDTGCWEWIGARGTNGYGIFAVHGKNRPAHRLSWEWANGREMAAGMYACHTCDNKLCVNPDHIVEGTPSENVKHAWRSRDRGKKAIPKPERPKADWHEAHAYTIKLTPEIIAELKRRRETERCSYGSMARELGVSEGAVRFACQGKRWGHLEKG